MTVRTLGVPAKASRAALIFICILALAQAAAAATVATGSFQLAPGQSVEVPIVLDTAPGGMSGYRITVTLSNPSVADITAVAFPDWAGLKSATTVPADSVVIQAVDLSSYVPIGGAEVTLATITVTGRAAGSTPIVVTPDASLGIQDRNGNPYAVATPPGSVTVSGGQGPGPTPTQGTVTTQPTAAPTGGATTVPTTVPTGGVTTWPTAAPTGGVTTAPTGEPTVAPTQVPVTGEPTIAPTLAPGVPTLSPTAVPATPVPPADATYAQAKANYNAAAQSWSLAWGASDFAVIRQYLMQSRAEFTNALNVANAVNDPANAANLVLVRTISTAYIDLANAALAMYDGADIYNAGRSQMMAGAYAEAAASFQVAGDTFASSQTLFTRATATLQSVTYEGTEYGDGSAYTATIVPILNAKGAYMGEFATYARGWQHTALAYQASVLGDQAAFRNEATQAMNLFATLQTSASFGADATANYNVLAGLLA